MEFTRRKVKGRSRQTYREWRDESGQYRITWRSEVYGIPVTPAYYSTVLSTDRNMGRDFWSFCGAKRPYRTKNAAVEAAEKNQRLWQKAIQIAEGERKGRNDRLRALEVSSRIGSGGTGHKVMGTLPKWARHPIVEAVLFANARRAAEDERADS